jgi:serine protease Do
MNDKLIRMTWNRWAVGVASACVLFGFGAPQTSARLVPNGLIEASEPATPDFRPVSTTQRLPDFVPVAKKVGPVVVNISALQTKPPAGSANPFGDAGPGSQFFGMPPPPDAGRQQSLGSGVIISRDGVILTNHHLVDGAKKITVKLSDGSEFEGKVVGRDPRTDIAVLKINAEKTLPSANLGNSARLQVGEWVIAVGNPFGLDNTVTSGIVSAKGRHIGAGPYDNFIQTDVPINPGSSGGPLIDMRGEVVGINTAILSQTGVNIGIGFATPIDLVKEILPQLREKGKVTRGSLGVAIQRLTPQIADALGLQKLQGALVAEVVESQPAHRAGVRVGDVITEFDDNKIQDANTLPLMVARTPVGKKVQLKVVRESKELTLTATIAELQEPRPAQKRGELG